MKALIQLLAVFGILVHTQAVTVSLEEKDFIYLPYAYPNTFSFDSWLAEQMTYDPLTKLIYATGRIIIYFALFFFFFFFVFVYENT